MFDYMPKTVDFHLYLITDRHQVPANHTLVSTVTAALEGGVAAVQLREKDLSSQALRPLALELRNLTAAYGAKLFINHHVDLALEIAADGVHLGRQSLQAFANGPTVGSNLMIGVSTHSVDEIQQAAEFGADFVTFGPVYATPSKAGYGPPKGVKTLVAACQKSPLPVFALGGISPDRVVEVMDAGAHGIALISGIVASPTPKKAARSFMT